MSKRICIFLLCCFLPSIGNARPLNQQNDNDYIVVLKEPSLSNSLLDEQGKSVYKGISIRKRDPISQKDGEMGTQNQYKRDFRRHHRDLEHKQQLFEKDFSRYNCPASFYGPFERHVNTSLEEVRIKDSVNA